jgi:hypothetical protein
MHFTMVQSINDCNDAYRPLEQSPSPPPAPPSSKSTCTMAVVVGPTSRRGGEMCANDHAKKVLDRCYRIPVSQSTRRAGTIVAVQLLLLLLVIVAIGWFRPRASWSRDQQSGTDSEHDDDDVWKVVSAALWSNVAHDFAVALQALSSLATAYTAQGALSQSTTLNATSSSWPYVTVPSFEPRAAIALRQCRHCTMVQVVPQVMSSQRQAWELYAVAHCETWSVSPPTVHRSLLDLTVAKANGTLASNNSLFRRPSYQSTTHNSTHGQRHNQTNATRISVPIPPPPPLRFKFDNAGMANRIFTWSKNDSKRADGNDCDHDEQVSSPAPEPDEANTDYYGK